MQGELCYNELMFTRILAFLLIFYCGSPAYGDFKKGVSIRDSEIELILRNYLDPLFKTAGLNPEEARIVMVVDKSLNAAALPNNTLLFHTGFLMEAGGPEEIAGVLAHEVGHIGGRHLVRMYGAMERSQNIGIFGAILGAAVAMLGSPDAGMAIALGGSSQALHTFLHYRRGEEEVADMLALKYLQKLGWPIKGLRTFLQKLLGQELLSETMQDPYLRTHPITSDRVSRVRGEETNTPGLATKMPEKFYEQHERMVVKLKAFLWSSSKTLKTFTGDSLIDRYAQAIAYYRQVDFDQALKLVEGLLLEEPENPFFWELKGQILFDSGRVKESAAPYEKAVSLMPKSALLQVALAQSLLKSKDPKRWDRAEDHLRKALALEKENGMAWYHLAVAYGHQKEMSKMALCLAERVLLVADWEEALEQSERSKRFAKTKSRDTMRADEISKTAKEKLLEQKKRKRLFSLSAYN